MPQAPPAAMPQTSNRTSVELKVKVANVAVFIYHASNRTSVELKVTFLIEYSIVVLSF